MKLRLSILVFLLLCFTSCGPGKINFKLNDLVGPPVSGDSSSLSLSFTSSPTAMEGSPIEVVATLSSPSESTISFRYQTENDETLNVLDRAEMVQDYTQSFGTVTFNAGETQKTISIPTFVDALYTRTKKFKLNLSEAQNISLSASELELSILEQDSSIFGADTARIYVTAGPDYAPAYLFPAPLATLYVDESNGNDSNNGQSEGSAFASINAAAAIATAGTTVLVKNGTYKEQVSVAHSGTASAPVIFKAFPGHSPTVTGAEELTGITLVNDAPSEMSDLLAEGMEQGSLDSTLTTASPFGRTQAAVEVDAISAAHGNNLLAFTFPSADATDNGTTITKSFPSPYLDSFFFRGHIAMASGLTAIGGGTRFYLASLDGPNSGGTNTRFIKLYLRKVSGQDQYYFDIQNASNQSMYTSQAESLFVIPGGGYVSFEFGLDSSDPVSPIKFYINGVAKTLTNQTDLTNCKARIVRFGVQHDNSGIILSNTSKIMYDSVRMSTTYNGPFSPVWPPQTAHSESFETDLGAFVESETDGNSVEVSSAQKKYGNQSAVLSFNGSSAVTGMNHTFTAKEDVYARFFFYLQDFDLTHTNASSTVNAQRWTLMTLSEGSVPRFKLAVAKTIQGLKLDAEVLTPAVTDISYLYKGYPSEIELNKWYQIELRFKGGSLIGGAEVWLDAVSIAGNYDRTPNPDVYYGLDTRGMKIDKVTFGELTTGQSYSSTTYPVANSKVFIDDYRLNIGAPSGLLPNSDPFRIYKASFNPAIYAGMDTNRPAVMTLSDSANPEGKLLKNVENKYVVSAGSFAVDGTTIYFRPHHDDVYTSQFVEYGVRDVGFLLNNKSHVVIDKFNVRSTNHANKAGIYLPNGSQYVTVMNNLLQANAGAGVRMEGELNEDEDTVIKAGDNNRILANHFRDNILAFGSGIRIDSSGHTLIEHNLFESETGTNISIECLDQVTCRGYKIRRNRMSSAGESHIYIAVYAHDSYVYGNWLSGARSSSYHTMKYGVRGSSGGSGVHIARGGHDNFVFNNLMYDLDTGGLNFRAKVFNNISYNNTILRVAAKGVGTGIDFQKDGNEVGIGDLNGNGVPDGQEDTENNSTFNNIIGMTPGSNRCIDVEGYAVTPQAGVSPVDTSNRSDFNLFYQCGRVALFGGQTYPESQLASYIANTLSLSGLQRDSHSSVLSSDPFVNSANQDYRLATPIPGACKIGVNCP